MGGFTKVMLKDTSHDNIARHNARLEIAGVPRQYRFTDTTNALVEYEWYLAHVNGDPNPKARQANYPEHQFPRDKIKSFEDFCKCWHPQVCGETFVPPPGALTFDCYFGRTSRKAMRAIGKYLMANVEAIATVAGSFQTFMERGMTIAEREEFMRRCAPAIKQELRRLVA